MLKKTAEITVVFRDIKREEVVKNRHKIGKNSFTIDRKTRILNLNPKCNF